MTVTQRFVGQSVARREDDRLLRGKGRFVADLASPATLQIAFVRSSQAHARIRIDVAAAREQSGVVLVLTGDELALYAGPLPMLHRPNAAFAEVTAFELQQSRLPNLATDRVHYVGQPVVAVVALDRATAEDAAELVEVDYDPLSVLLSPSAALAEGAPQLHEAAPRNLAARILVQNGSVSDARDLAFVTVRETYRMGRHSGVPLECRGSFGTYDHRRARVELWTSTQIPHMVRDAICSATGWGTDELRVAAPDVGGGFGPKANVYGEEVVVAVIARLLGREVIWIEDRWEHLVAAAQGRDQVHDAMLSVDADGRILAWEDEFKIDVGANSLWVAGIIANTALHILGGYRIPTFQIRGEAAYTNKTPVAQYRGAGRPEACFVLERSLDSAARAVGISPAEIRRRNLLGPEDLPYSQPVPYRDGVPIVYDGADYRRCLEACLEALPADAIEEERAKAPEALVGYGIATYVEATGRGPYESASVHLNSSGTFHVAAGSASAGQGHETTLGQVAADALGTDPSCIRVVNGDTDAIAFGIGTFASRSAVLAGSAVHIAAGKVVERGAQLAGRLLQVAPEVVDQVAGGFRAPDGRNVTWAALAAALAPGGELEDEESLEVTARFAPPTVTWTMGVHAGIVKIDPDTGLCSVVRYAVAHETGPSIHPQIVDGQVIGGVAQGIGGALLEEFRYTDQGQPVSTTFAEYLLPCTTDVPQVEVVHVHGGTDRNPLGIKGVGESGTIPVYAVIAAAVDDALGIDAPRMRATPITPDVLRAAARLLGPARDA